MKIYFDQNYFQELIETNTVEALKKEIKLKGIDICLSIHNIYEFGRCFLKKSNLEKGKLIFNYLYELDLKYFIKSTDKLIYEDLIYALKGGKILPYLDSINTIGAKQEIYNLSKANFKEAKGFIKKREDSMYKNGPIYKESLINANKGKKKPKNYLEMRDNYLYRRQILNDSKFRSIANNISDTKLFSNYDKYPFVNTYINCELYFSYMALTSKDGPSMKRISDLRHLISANAADCLITRDEDLKKRIPELCLYLKVKDNI